MTNIFNFTIVYILIAAFHVNAKEYPILFTKQKNGTDNIYMIAKNGESKQITNHPRKDSTPMLSPDGKYIVFTSERVGWWKIWLMDIEQKKYKQLTDASSAEYAPCWSPTGKEIVFVSSRNGNAELYIISIDGSKPRNITRNPYNDNMPFWGEDDKIYYSSEIDGVFQVVRINPDGSNKEILSKGAGNKYMPQLSPNQQKVLFYGDKDGNPEIYTMKINGSDLQRLTKNPLMDIRAQWSPDGEKIVFENGDKRKNQHIFIMDEDGANKKQLTFTDYNYAPSFVSNSSYLCNNKH